MRVPLTTMTQFINVVITLGYDDQIKRKDSYLGLIGQWANENMSYYAYIYHDRDMLENGLPKTPHVHLVGKTISRHRLSSVVTDLSSFLAISSFTISIEKMNDVAASIKYLIHKDNPDKFKYPLAEIRTNLKQDELQLYIDNQSDGSFGVETLVNAVKQSGNRLDLMRSIGLGQYHFYRREIDDIAYLLGKDWFK